MLTSPASSRPFVWPSIPLPMCQPRCSRRTARSPTSGRTCPDTEHSGPLGPRAQRTRSTRSKTTSRRREDDHPRPYRTSLPNDDVGLRGAAPYRHLDRITIDARLCADHERDCDRVRRSDVVPVDHRLLAWSKAQTWSDHLRTQQRQQLTMRFSAAVWRARTAEFADGIPRGSTEHVIAREARDESCSRSTSEMLEASTKGSADASTRQRVHQPRRRRAGARR